MAPAAGTLTLHTLHPSRSGTPECERMFDTLGYGTLNTYYADTSVEGCEGRGKPIFRNYMNKVTGELHQLITEGLAEKVRRPEPQPRPNTTSRLRRRPAAARFRQKQRRRGRRMFKGPSTHLTGAERRGRHGRRLRPRRLPQRGGGGGLGGDGHPAGGGDGRGARAGRGAGESRAAMLSRASSATSSFFQQHRRHRTSRACLGRRASCATRARRRSACAPRESRGAVASRRGQREAWGRRPSERGFLTDLQLSTQTSESTRGHSVCECVRGPLCLFFRKKRAAERACM